MKPSFTLAVVLCFAALIAVVMGAALSTLVDGALRSQTLGLDLLAGETAATLRQSLEKVFRRATTSMLTQRNATKRVGYPFAPPSPDAASQAVNATSAHRQWMALTLGAASMIPPFSVIVVRWAVSGAALSSSRGPGSTQGQLCQVLNPRPLPTQLADINVNCTLQAYQETDLAVPNTSSLLVGFVAPARSAYLAAAWNATRQIMLNPPPKFGAWQDQVQFYSQLQYFIAKNASETVETFLAPFVTMSFEPDGVTPIAMLIGSMAYSHFDAVLRDLVSGVPGACALLVRRATITTAGQPPSDRVISDSSGSTFTVMFSNETGGSVWNGCAVFGARIGCLYNISTHPPYEILRLRIAQLPAASGEVTLASGEQYYGFTQQLSNDFFAFPFEVHVFLPRAYFFAAIERARVVTVLVAVLVSVLGVALACPLLLRMAASVGDLADRLHDPFSPLSTSDSGGVAAAVTATGITGWLCPFCSSFEVEEVAALEREFAAFREVIAVVRGFMYADGGRGGGVEHLGDPIDSSGFVASSTDTSAPTDTSRLEIAPMPAANVVTIAVGSIGAAATDDAAADKSMTSSSKRRRNNVPFAATVVDRAGPSAARPVKPKCFVACVHVFGFQSLRLRHEARARIADVTITKGRGSTAALAVERECMQSADSQMISAELISFSTFVIERFGRLARSVGATLFELHGDHFLVCVRIRDAFKSKMPVRFADRLI